MRSSVLLSAAAFAAALAGCGQTPSEPAESTATEPEAVAPQTPVTDRVSATDKAAIDELSTDVERLLGAYNQSTGTRQEYALVRLREALNNNPEGVQFIEKNAQPWSDPWRAAKEARTSPAP